MGRPSKYSDEFCRDAVALYRASEGRRTFAAVAKEIGVNHETLRNWVRAADAEPASTGQALNADERAELARLVGPVLVGPTRETARASGWGELRCLVRLSAQLDILCLMTRGLDRNRFGGSRRSWISRRARASARVSREGGKRRLVGDVAAGDPQGADEGDSVGVRG